MLNMPLKTQGFRKCLNEKSSLHPDRNQFGKMKPCISVFLQFHMPPRHLW